MPLPVDRMICPGPSETSPPPACQIPAPPPACDVAVHSVVSDPVVEIPATHPEYGDESQCAPRTRRTPRRPSAKDRGVGAVWSG